MPATMSAFSVFAIVWAGALGACLGSFANVVAMRWHEGASVRGRSMCPDCQTPLRARHLVPIVSWLWLRGRCAECRRPIHVQYPLVEAASALLVAGAAWRHPPFMPGSAAPFLFEALFFVALLVPVVMDIRWKELPLEWLVGMGTAGLAASVLGIGFQGGESAWTRFGASLSAMSAAAIFFGLQWRLSRGRWLGEGDVWMGAALGAALGWPLAAWGVYAAYLLGGVVALAGLATGKLRRGQQMPFGPMLAAGAAAALWLAAPASIWMQAYGL
jgi:leader peptidase (prepilin peptidase)/N-methyltransferase